MLACSVRWAEGPEHEHRQVRTEFEHRRCEVRSAGGLVVDVEGERYRIEAGDVKGLIFAGRPAPVVRESDVIVAEMTIEGHAAVNPAGRAVVIRTRAGSWIVPLVSFRRVACGEEVRGAVFGLVGEGE